MTQLQWHYANRSGQQQGPVSTEDLRAAWQRGELDANSLVWRDGLAQWLPLSQMSAELGLNTGPPPLPGMAGAGVPGDRERVAYVAPARKKISGMGWLLIIGGIVVVALVPIAIIAAIAISQYQDYVGKSQFSEAIAIANALEVKVSEHHQDAGTCPSNADMGDSQLSGLYVARVELPGGPAPCTIVAVFRDDSRVAAPLRGARVTFTEGADGWTCRSSLPNKFKPRACQDSGAN